MGTLRQAQGRTTVRANNPALCGTLLSLSKDAQSNGAILLFQCGAIALPPVAGLPASGGPVSTGPTVWPQVNTSGSATDPNRPAGLKTANAGVQHLDAFLQRLIFWDGNNWRDAVTNAIS